MEYSVRFHARTLGLAFRRSLLLNDRGLSIPKRGAVVVSVKSTPSAPQHPRDKDAIAAIEPGDFIVAVNGERVVQRDYTEVCKMIASTSRPVKITFRRLPKAVKSDFRTASKGVLLRQIAALARSLARADAKRESVRKGLADAAPVKAALLEKMQQAEAAVEDLNAARTRGTDESRELQRLDGQITEALAKKQKLIAKIKSIKRQIKAKELEHDLVYYAFRGVSQRLSRERGVTEESQAAEVAGSSNASVASGASGATDDNDAVAPAGTSSGAGAGTGAGAGAGAGSGGAGGVEDADPLPADMPLTWTGRHKQHVQILQRFRKHLEASGTARMDRARGLESTGPASPRENTRVGRIHTQSRKLAGSLRSSGQQDDLANTLLSVAFSLVEQNTDLQKRLDAHIAATKGRKASGSPLPDLQ